MREPGDGTDAGGRVDENGENGSDLFCRPWSKRRSTGAASGPASGLDLRRLAFDDGYSALPHGRGGVDDDDVTVDHAVKEFSQGRQVEFLVGTARHAPGNTGRRRRG